MADFNSQDQLQDSEIIQDTMSANTLLDGEGNQLSAITGGTNQTLGKLSRWISGISRLLGEASRRAGAARWNGSSVSGTGTITTSGTAVTGSGTAFTTEFTVGDFIGGDTDLEFREITTITDNTNIVLVAAFTADISVGQAFSRLGYLAERLDDLGASRDYIGGLEVSYASSSTITIATGLAKDDTNSDGMDLSAATTKNLLAAFATGTGNGCKDATMTTGNDDDIHLFLIKNPTTSGVDILASNSATSPTLPSGFTIKKWFCALKFNGTNVIPDFNYVNGWVELKSPGDGTNLDWSASITTTASLHVMFVPLGKKFPIRMRTYMGGASVTINVTDPDSTDLTPSGSLYPLGDIYDASVNAQSRAREVTTDTSGQVRARNSSTTITVKSVAMAWRVR